MGKHVCALLVVFVFPGHDHDWFCVRVGHDEVLVVRVSGFSLGVLIGSHWVFVHMWICCFGLSVVCCSPYPTVCTIQFFSISIRGVY